MIMTVAAAEAAVGLHHRGPLPAPQDPGHEPDQLPERLIVMLSESIWILPALPALGPS